MVSLLVGNKGCGKTKRLIECVEKALSDTKGNVVVVEKGGKLTYNVPHEARLIDADQYNISGYKSLYGFLCGVCAGNYDVTDILVDSTLKICDEGLHKLPEFLNNIKRISEQSNTNFVFLISADEKELSDDIDSEIKRI